MRPAQKLLRWSELYWRPPKVDHLPNCESAVGAHGQIGCSKAAFHKASLVGCCLRRDRSLDRESHVRIRITLTLWTEKSWRSRMRRQRLKPGERSTTRRVPL